MRLVFLPSLIAPIAEVSFGGAELAARALAEGMAARGHEVTLIGLPGTHARGVRPWIVPRGTPIFRPGEERALVARSSSRDDSGEPLRSRDVAASGTALIAGVAVDDPFPEIFSQLRSRELDVLHLHLLDPSALLLAEELAIARPEVKVIATLHLAAVFPATAAIVPSLSHVVLTAPSAFAASTWNARVTVVPNGIEPSRIALAAQAPASARLAWAGRRSREKGLQAAAAIAEKAQMPLSIAGPDAPEGSVRVAGDIEDLGVLPRDEVARRLFARATATLVTSTIPESFSLVALESLATGTPVVAFDLGALRELIEPGETGVLVPPGDLDAAARACREIHAGAIDRARCRERALARFDHARTIDLFEQLYAAR